MADQAGLTLTQQELLQKNGRESVLAVLQIDGTMEKGPNGALAFPAKVWAVYNADGALAVPDTPVVWVNISGEKQIAQSPVSLFTERFYTVASQLRAADYLAAYVRFQRMTQGAFATALLRRKRTVLATASIYGVHKIKPIQAGTDLYAWQGYVIGIAQERLLAAYGPSGSMALAIAVGDRTGVDRQTISAFAAVGVIHALVASGATIRMITDPIVAFLRRQLRLRYGIWYAVSTFIIATIVVLSGIAPPAFRSGVALTYELTALLVHRKPDRITANVLAACSLDLIEPHLLIDPGVILSFVAVTAFSILPANIASWWLSFIPFRKIKTLLARGLAADLAVAPVAGYEFMQLSVVSLLTNVLLYPVLEWLLPLAWFFLLFAVIAPPLAHSMQPVVSGLFELIKSGITGLSVLGTSMQVHIPSFASLVFYESFLLLLLFIGRRYTTRDTGKYLE